MPSRLQVTYCPDCTRGVTYDMKRIGQSGASNSESGEDDWLRAATFYNHVFGCLFLGETVNVKRL